MKPVKYGLLSFFTGIYFTIGGFGWYIYSVLLAIKVTERNFSDAPKPPYPLFCSLGFIGVSIAYLIIGGILIYKLFKNKPRGKSLLVKAGLFILPMVCSIYLTREGIIYWQSTPHINREEAIKTAMRENQSSVRTNLRDAYWDGDAWIITFSDERDQCKTITISRLGTSSSYGTCNK